MFFHILHFLRVHYVPACAIVFGIAVLLILRLILKWKQQKERDEWARTAQEQQANWDRMVEQARKRFFAETPKKVYFNTIAGVTAVLPPLIYDVTQEVTERARIDGRWNSPNVLMPHANTSLFVTEQGRTRVQESSKGTGHIAGNLSDLRVAEKEYTITLEKKEDIFVPWISEGLLTFDAQAEQLNDPKAYRGIQFLADCLWRDATQW